MAEHRASVLSATLRRYEDPARSRDPRIRQIVADLRTLEPAPAPRAHFRAELRAQLVAVAPRLVAEGVGVERPATAARPAARTTVRSGFAPVRNRRAVVLNRGTAAIERVSSINLARPVAILTAVVAVFALILGSAVWVSKKSLPGDPLYALKRANEDVQLSLTTGDAARGEKYLNFASNRVDEVSDLLKRADAVAAAPGANAAGTISKHTAKLVADTLDDADGDVRNAAQLLGREAVDSKSPKPLTVMTNWAPDEIQKLQLIASRIPAGSLHDRASASAQLAMDAMGRAAILQGLLDCSCLASSGTDELGPIPCTVCVEAPTQLPSLPTTPGTSSGSSGASGTPGSSTGGISSAPNPSGGTDSGGILPSLLPTDGGSSSPGGVNLPTVNVPTITIPNLPLPTPSHSPTCVINLLGLCVRI
ncbi:MAG TPA: DUF5667 domain-containing protein [Jatrophihabitantaceae bacterium]|nr:DUF5667 domain-containing protein [Jatrophihabitantaceae bacterium]